jgi:putative flippase GtrA
MSQSHQTLLRSAAVGAAATVVDLTLLAFLVSGLGLSPLAANVPSLLGGVLAQFFGNKYLAFQDHRPELLRQGLLFGLVEVGALSLNAAGFHLLVSATAVGYLPARLLVSALVYFAFSYPLWRRIFRPSVCSVSHRQTLPNDRRIS